MESTDKELFWKFYDKHASYINRHVVPLDLLPFFSPILPPEREESVRAAIAINGRGYAVYDFIKAIRYQDNSHVVFFDALKEQAGLNDLLTFIKKKFIDKSSPINEIHRLPRSSGNGRQPVVHSAPDHDAAGLQCSGSQQMSQTQGSDHGRSGGRFETASQQFGETHDPFLSISNPTARPDLQTYEGDAETPVAAAAGVLAVQEISREKVSPQLPKSIACHGGRSSKLPSSYAGVADQLSVEETGEDTPKKGCGNGLAAAAVSAISSDSARQARGASAHDTEPESMANPEQPLSFSLLPQQSQLNPLGASAEGTSDLSVLGNQLANINQSPDDNALQSQVPVPCSMVFAATHQMEPLKESTTAVRIGRDVGRGTVPRRLADDFYVRSATPNDGNVSPIRQTSTTTAVAAAAPAETDSLSLTELLQQSEVNSRANGYDGKPNSVAEGECQWLDDSGSFSATPPDLHLAGENSVSKACQLQTQLSEADTGHLLTSDSGLGNTNRLPNETSGTSSHTTLLIAAAAVAAVGVAVLLAHGRAGQR